MRILVGMCLAAAALLAQSGPGGVGKKPEAPAGPAPRAADGKPSLSGVWNIPYVPDMSRGVGALPFTPWGEEN